MRQVLRSVRPEKVVTDASTKLQHDTARGRDMKINGIFLSTCDRYVNYIKSCLLQSEWEAFGILDFLFHVPETPRRFIWPFRSSYFHNYHILTCPPCQQCHKVNRCLARYSPRATTTNRLTNRAPKKPAWPGPNRPKMPILGQIWSFLGKKSFFLLEKSKVLLPT